MLCIEYLVGSQGALYALVGGMLACIGTSITISYIEARRRKAVREKVETIIKEFNLRSEYPHSCHQE